jgi:CheY-like chemotaxis protein
VERAWYTLSVWIDNHGSGYTRMKVAPTKRRKQPATVRILVVDDEDAITDLLETLLVDVGYRVMTAHDGQQALAMAREQLPDIVLTDVMMPFMDGLELLHHLRKDARTSNIPVILMSAASRYNADAAIADGFLAKPFDIDDVIACINHVLTVPS